MSFLVNILLLILVIGILTFVHELGHFIAAKLVKAKVFDFSIGFGPKILSKKYKDTIYNIRLLPLGGFVKILGDGDPSTEKENSKDSGNLKNKSKLAQMFVMVAGVTMNILLAVVFYYIFLANFSWKMDISPEYENFNPVGATITRERISDIPYEVAPEGSAQESGMFERGYIQSVNGNQLEYYQDLSTTLEEYKGESVDIHACEEESTNCQTFEVNVSDEGRIGVYVGYNYYVFLDYSQSKYTAGFAHSVNMVKLTGTVFGSLFREAKETGDYTALSQSVSGPVGIYFIIDYFKTLGLPIFLGIVADLSISLAIINILPIPALDGGRIAILFFEGIFRKDLDERIESWIINISFILLILLIVGIMFKDILTIDQLQNIFK